MDDTIKQILGIMGKMQQATRLNTYAIMLVCGSTLINSITIGIVIATK